MKRIGLQVIYAQQHPSPAKEESPPPYLVSQLSPTKPVPSADGLGPGSCTLPKDEDGADEDPFLTALGPVPLSQPRPSTATPDAGPITLATSPPSGKSSSTSLGLPARLSPGPSFTETGFKLSDVRTDQIAHHCICFMQQILREAGMDLDVVTYRVTPTGQNEGNLPSSGGRRGVCAGQRGGIVR
jgi:hypothetical protein